MSILRKYARVLAVLSTAMFMSATLTATTQAASKSAATSSEFTGSGFTCLQYTNGLGANSSGKAQTMIAHLWILGYLTGYGKAAGKLNMVDDADDMKAIDSVIETRCKEYPSASIMAVSMLQLSKDLTKLPKTTGTDLVPGAYTCAQHTEARNGNSGAATNADLAEMWAFAYIQGYKNVGAPDMEIKIENKPAIIGVLNRACAKSADTLYMDLAAQVAEKVKIAG